MIKKKYYKNKKHFFTIFFGDKEFIKLFLKLAIPAILQQLISLAVVYVDNFMLATLLTHDGSTAKTAVGLTNHIVNFSIYFLSAWISGTGIMLSQYYGNKDYTKSRETLFLRIWFSYVLLLPMILIIVLMPGQLIKLTTSVSTSTTEFLYSRFYLFIFGFSLIPTSFTYCLSQALMETKRQIISFFAAFIGVICNMILDPIVIIIFKDNPFMAVGMVSLTTLISRIVQLTFCLIYIIVKNDNSLNIFNRKKSVFHYDICYLNDINKWKYFDKKTVKNIFRYSLPAFINDAIYGFAYLLLSICFLSFGKGDENYYNAITNALLMVSFVEVIWPGMSTASSILVAAKLGEGKINEAKKNANLLLRWSGVVIFAIIIFLFICSLFINNILSAGNDYVIELSKRLQWIILPILISQGMFSSLYFSIRSGGTKLIIVADCLVMFIWAIVMMGLTFSDVVNNLSPEIFFFIIESNQLVKFILASIVYKKSNWARNLTNNKEILWNH